MYGDYTLVMSFDWIATTLNGIIRINSRPSKIVLFGVLNQSSRVQLDSLAKNGNLPAFEPCDFQVWISHVLDYG